jgi:AcrR family transcriptional regulator
MPTSAPGQAQRRTKAERSAATRARLLDATIGCLVELGWSGTSTTEVVARAGVSRGAQVHHFPTKEDLVLAAIEHLCERRLQEYRDAFARLPAAERTSTAAFDLLRSLCSGPTMDAWLELAVAARTDPVLHRRFVEVDQRFWENALANYRDMFPEAAVDPVFFRISLRLSFCLVDGMTVARLTDADPSEIDGAAEAFKLLIAPFALPSPGTTPGRTT